MQSTFLPLLTICLASHPRADDLDEWKIFKLQHNKQYDSQLEDDNRREIFMNTKRKIERHNADFRDGLVSFELCLNQFADLDSNEITRMMKGVEGTDNRGEDSSDGRTYVKPENVELPNSVDWRKLGAVTEAKLQQNCSSCWSFSAVGALEGQIFLRTGRLITLSAQQLIDCSREVGNRGCGGGLPDQAFRYVKNTGWIYRETSYPYQDKDDVCPPVRETSRNSGISIFYIEQGNEDDLKAAVATVGPISAAIDAEYFCQHIHYKQGIISDSHCSTTEVDHAVLVVGYGTEKNNKGEDEDYWLIKNSWGENWGIGGYAKISRNRNNTCGVASQASFPLLGDVIQGFQGITFRRPLISRNRFSTLP